MKRRFACSPPVHKRDGRGPARLQHIESTVSFRWPAKAPRFEQRASSLLCRRTFRFAYEAAGLQPRPRPSPPNPLARLLGGFSRQLTLQKDSANDRGFPEEDVSFLRSLSQNLTSLGFTLPDKA